MESPIAFGELFFFFLRTKKLYGEHSEVEKIRATKVKNASTSKYFIVKPELFTEPETAVKEMPSHQLLSRTVHYLRHGATKLYWYAALKYFCIVAKCPSRTGQVRVKKIKARSLLHSFINEPEKRTPEGSNMGQQGVKMRAPAFSTLEK